MPWPKTTLEETRARMAADYELRYQEADITVDAHTRGTGHTEKVNAFAALAFGLRLNQEHIISQQFIGSMDEATVLRVGGELGVYRIAPSYAAGDITVTGMDGTVIEKNTVLSHASGALYRVLNQTVIAGTTTIAISAMETGLAGNLAEGESLSWQSVIPGVDSTVAIAAGGLTNGQEIEDLERFRDRVKERRKQPPLGGAAHDYLAWAKAASSLVTDAWTSPHENAIGEVILRFVTESEATPFPSAALVQTVQNYVDDIKPVEARIVVQAPSDLPLDLSFNSLSPNTAEMQAAVEAELNDLLSREVRSDSTLYLNKIRAAIFNTPGLEDFNLSLNSNVQIGVDEYCTLGTTSFPAIT